MAEKNRIPARGALPAGRAWAGGALLLASVVGVALLPRAGAEAARRAALANSSPSGEAAPGVVDSIFPIEEEIRRFRDGLPEVTRLSEGAASMDELVSRFVGAVERADTAALVPLLLTRAEFGWLYYPHTMYTEKPYELSPALLWFQMQNLTDRGVVRLFRQHGGRTLHADGWRCEDAPTEEGPNRVWSGCHVRIAPPGQAPYEARLFGSVVEREGVLKLVSLANDA